MNDIDVLLKAYEITDSVFQERGYGAYQVDLMQYLRTGNTKVFTSTNGARNSIENIPFEEMTASVKKAIIDGSIEYLTASKGRNKSLANQIPERMKLWAIDKINHEGYTSFNQLYSEAARYPRDPYKDTICLVNTLIESKRYGGVESLDAMSLSNEMVEIISVLENQKRIIDEELEKYLSEERTR